MGGTYIYKTKYGSIEQKVCNQAFYKSKKYKIREEFVIWLHVLVARVLPKSIVKKIRSKQ